jgi:hypothetical protein
MDFHYQHVRIYVGTSSVADPHRKNADVYPGQNLNADPDADSCPY